jgi:hypothetical protein
MMELWACGFNAWGQLSFEDVVEEEPRDFHSFKCILKDKNIEILRTTLSQTLGMAWISQVQQIFS